VTVVTAFVANVFLPPGRGILLPVVNPATEEQVASVEESGSATVDQAVEAARHAFRHGPWRRMDAAGRQAVLAALNV